MQTQKSIAHQPTLRGKAEPESAALSRIPEEFPKDMDRASLLEAYMPLVKIIVSRMRSKLPSHADLEELESIGTMGLLAAIERYDSSRGYTFQTYASVRIRGAILDELRAMDMVPRSVRLKQRLISRTSNSIEQRTGRMPTDGEMCDALGLDRKAYDKLRSQTQPVNVVYLDGQEEGGVDLHDVIADENTERITTRIEREEMLELVARKIMELPEQHRRVMALYFNEGMRLAEIGEVMGLSEARICQIRSQALEHLRKFVKRMDAA
jgi:RNA polymerase sigma factor for flagellar operon FliA